MKNYLIISLLFLFVGCSKEPIKFEQLVNRDDLFYKKNTNEPYSGYVFGKVQGYVENGKLNGLFSYYFDNGNLSKSGEYNFGQQVGSWTYYDTDGELILELTLDNDGLWKSYHTNGDISSQGTLDNSEFHSDWKYFREEDGSISKTEKWFFGTMIEQIFYNINGTKSYEQKFYLDGPLKTIKSFSPNGIIKFVESFDGERKYHGVIEDYDDGLLHEKHFYEHGKQNKRINYVYPEHREGWTEIVRDYKDNTETFRFINQKGEIYRVESKDCNVRSCLN